MLVKNGDLKKQTEEDKEEGIKFFLKEKQPKNIIKKLL